MTNSPVLQAIQARRSVRSYRRDPVPRDVLESLVTAGLWAPSASNRQELTFVAVDDAGDLGALYPFAPGLRGDPPAVIVLCVDLRRLPAVVSGDPVTAVVYMDVAMAAQNILLAAQEAGLGACAIHSFRPAAAAVAATARQPSAAADGGPGLPARIPPHLGAARLAMSCCGDGRIPPGWAPPPPRARARPLTCRLQPLRRRRVPSPPPATRPGTARST